MASNPNGPLPRCHPSGGCGKHWCSRVPHPYPGCTEENGSAPECTAGSSARGRVKRRWSLQWDRVKEPPWMVGMVREESSPPPPSTARHCLLGRPHCHRGLQGMWDTRDGRDTGHRPQQSLAGSTVLTQPGLHGVDDVREAVSTQEEAGGLLVIARCHS